MDLIISLPSGHMSKKALQASSQNRSPRNSLLRRPFNGQRIVWLPFRGRCHPKWPRLRCLNGASSGYTSLVRFAAVSARASTTTIVAYACDESNALLFDRHMNGVAEPVHVRRKCWPRRQRLCCMCKRRRLMQWLLSCLTLWR